MINLRRPDSAEKITAVYVVAASAWALISDYLVIRLVHRHRLEELVFDADRLLFILAFAVILRQILKRQFLKRDAAIRLVRELNRSHHMITACTEAMIRARTRQDLFDEICRIAVVEGGYLMAWVGLAQDDAEKTVLPTARAGRVDGYLESARIVWSDTERGRGPTGSAIRLNKPKSSSFLVDDPSFSPWRVEAERRGYRSSLGIPLREGSKTIGALTMYSERTQAFDPAELALLDNLASTINYALNNLARQENERAQFETLRKLSHAVEFSPVTILITDAHGRIEYVNRKFSQITGYAPEEVLGKNPSVLKSDELPAEEYRKLWETIAAGEEWHGVFHNRAKNGEFFWEAASISPLKDEDGKITHYIAVKEDITAQRALEQQLRQAQKMEAVGTLAGGIAHDFNNILTVIQGHCSLLEASRLQTEGDKESVAEIQSSVERAAALTRQLLAFGRRQPLRPRAVDLGEAAERMSRMLRRVVPAEIELKTERPREPLFAHADPALVDQVLMNLILNARDAVSGHGRILIEVLPVEKHPSPEPTPSSASGWVMLRVSDDGRGIPAEILPRVFEPFFTTKPTGKGTGLGLAVVDGIVRQHKGWVEIDREVGKGSAFRVYLPRAETPNILSPAESKPVRRGNETILLVEDEGPLRRLCARGLERLGYRVMEAEDGDAAADLWKRHKDEVSLLVTDIVMPGSLSGGALARLLREDDPDLGIVYVSGRVPDLDDRENLLTENATFLPKPFTPEAMARAVRARLDREKL